MFEESGLEYEEREKCRCWWITVRNNVGAKGEGNWRAGDVDVGGDVEMNYEEEGDNFNVCQVQSLTYQTQTQAHPTASTTAPINPIMPPLQLEARSAPPRNPARRRDLGIQRQERKTRQVRSRGSARVCAW